MTGVDGGTLVGAGAVTALAAIAAAAIAIAITAVANTGRRTITATVIAIALAHTAALITWSAHYTGPNKPEPGPAPVHPCSHIGGIVGLTTNPPANVIAACPADHP